MGMFGKSKDKGGAEAQTKEPRLEAPLHPPAWLRMLRWFAFVCTVRVWVGVCLCLARVPGTSAHDPVWRPTARAHHARTTPRHPPTRQVALAIGMLALINQHLTSIPSTYQGSMLEYVGRPIAIQYCLLSSSTAESQESRCGFALAAVSISLALSLMWSYMQVRRERSAAAVLHGLLLLAARAAPHAACRMRHA
jgi:hypothetical protein